MTGISDQLIEEIQASGWRASIVITGGGVGALQTLLMHPGASRFVLEAQVPYSPQALFDYLGEEVTQACCEEAAALLAARALERALVFRMTGGGDFPILGIACTAALTTNRQRRGRDRAFVCIKSRFDQTACSLELPPGGRSEQDETVSSTLLKMTAEFLRKPSA